MRSGLQNIARQVLIFNDVRERVSHVIGVNDDMLGDNSGAFQVSVYY